MEQIRVLTFRVVNNLLDFGIFASAYFLGLCVFLVVKLGYVRLADIERFDWRSMVMIYLIFYGCNFFFLAHYQVYHSSRLRSVSKAMELYLRSCVMALLVAVIIVFLFPFLIPSRLQLISASGIAYFLLVLKEIALRHLLSQLRRSEKYQRRTVIVSKNKKLIEDLQEACEEDALLGFDIVGTVRPDNEEDGDEIDQLSIPVLGTVDELDTVLEEHHISSIICIGTEMSPGLLEGVVWTCEVRGVEVLIRLALLDRLIYHAQLTNVRGIPLIQFRSDPGDTLGLFLKSVFDRVASLALLTASAPLLIVLMGVVRISSKGSVIFKQSRAGLNGKPFTFYKFRTMYEDAEARKFELIDQNELDGPAFKITDDPRVTPIGKLLRKTSLDELPQLLNVVKGEMSLVGPRPLPVSEVMLFDGWHRRRLSMKPGITGLWQVAGRSEILSFKDWVRMDLEYIDGWNLYLDFVILLRTIPAVLIGRGAK